MVVLYDVSFFSDNNVASFLMRVIVNLLAPLVQERTRGVTDICSTGQQRDLSTCVVWLENHLSGMTRIVYCKLLTTWAKNQQDGEGTSHNVDTILTCGVKSRAVIDGELSAM